MVGFFLNSILLGVGLAMDAFSVSLANGLHEPGMARRRMCAVAGVYGVFQAVMPLTGWLLVHTAAERLVWLQAWIPWAAAALLGWIGGKMIRESRNPPEQVPALDGGTLLAQGAATSMDALSAGFAIAAYSWPEALGCAAIIAAVTFGICLAGLALGRRFGMVLAGRASVFGGLILLEALL